jgi:hypothetical protein
MLLDKVLGKIQGQIHELAPILELFVEDSIQPSVNDCDKLQAQLIKLQENLAVYKYNKQERELSPSFNLHSKVSEQNAVIEKKEEIKAIVIEETKSNVEEKTDEIKEEKTVPQKVSMPLLIGINDKFRITNELFNQNSGEYNVAIEQLSGLLTWAEAELYLNSLKTLYNWKENSEVVGYFFSLVKKRLV